MQSPEESPTSSASAPAQEPEGPRPAMHDIVVITLDTTRADHLSLYGYPRQTSPHLDRFAEQSMVFERFIVPMATTLPTHLSMFTGLWPMEHGVLANLKHGGARYLPGESARLLADWADDAGYRTGAFISSLVLRPETGIAKGFQTFDVPRRPSRRAGPTIDGALKWLGDQGDAQPTLLWVHLFDPHNPYAPPPSHRNRFMADDPEIDEWVRVRKHAPTGTRPTGEVVRTQEAIPLYDAEILYMDEHVGRLLRALQQRPRWDQTVVVIAGDHGEGLNQHGEPGHGLVWDEQLHAPLLVRIPGEPPRRIRTVLSAADLLPTVWSLAADHLPEASGFLRSMTGQDVLSSTFEERPVLSQHSERQLQFDKPRTWTLTGPRFKCRLDDQGHKALYDLSFDPWELDPRDDHPNLQPCIDALTREIDRQRSVNTTGGGPRSAPLRGDEAEALKALGYLAGDSDEEAE